MNEITLIQDGGPEATPVAASALRSARAALLAEIYGPAPVRRRPGRRTAFRVGAVVLTAAAAVTTVLVVGGTGGPAPRPGSGSADVALVDFTLPAFPLTLPTPPPGAGDPVFGADAAGGTSMGYESTTDPLQNVGVSVSAEPPPPGGSLSFPGWVPEQVTVNGAPAVLVAPTGPDDPEIASLDWQRRPGQWVTINAQGRYAQRELLLTLAAGLVDQPQPMPVQLHLAPAAYRLDVSKDDGRIIILSDDADPERGLVVRLLAPGQTEDLQTFADVAGQPAQEVTVQGQPAQLARTDLGGGGPQGWVVRAVLPGGSAVVVEAPGDLTADQVVQIADQVSYSA